MFPLSGVLLPGSAVALHVFEPRYRDLARDVTSAGGELGVVLIERGSEVGGGDTRCDVGTMARVCSAERYPDGRWGIVVAGDRRIRVDDWLPDDPYPRAEVSDWPDHPEEPPVGTSEHRRLVAMLRTSLALATELGAPSPPIGVEVADDPAVGGYQIAALAPIGPLDRQRILCARGVSSRSALLGELLADAIDTMRARIALGDG
ncbi:MAG: LON peptidase substrate-binding domain-containing protein [Acidimicrobiales bacterium]